MHCKPVSRSNAKASGQRFYFTGRACLRGHVADRYASSGECILCEQERRERAAATRRTRAANWYAQNAEAKKRTSAEWYTNNPATAANTRRAWRQNNKSAARAIDAHRRARKLLAMPGWSTELTDFVMQEAADLASMRERATGFAWDVDHMIPLAAKNACGLHVWNNLQVIPAALNGAKHNKMMWTEPGEWLVMLRDDFCARAP